MHHGEIASAPHKASALEVLLVFLKLGLTSFGGPVAHLGYFREEFVARRKWLDEASYADLVALCQFLPGPASSQVGIAIGLSRAGYPGAIAAWIGFTLPSAVAFPFCVWGRCVRGNCRECLAARPQDRRRRSRCSRRTRYDALARA
jgi:chromate transporter